MKECLYDLYIKNPGNYIVSGSGGVGKTTQLLHLTRKFLYEGHSLDNTIYIPIYIRLKDLNIMHVQPGILYELVAQYFNSSVNEKSINDMFSKTTDNYRYLLLLDGYNEIKEYITNNGEGQTVTSCLNNDIKKMCQYDNVNFIVTTRNESIISGKETFRNFDLIRIDSLTKEQIDKYIGHDILDEEPYLRDILTIPMLLKVFGEIYKQNPEKASRLNTKYDLLHEWILQDTRNKLSKYEDIDDLLREKVSNQVLPLYAFRVQRELIKDDLYTGSMDYEKIMGSVISDLNIQQGEQKQLEKTISRMSLLENNYSFVHDLIREFFAVYCLKMLPQHITYEEVNTTIKTISEFMVGKENSLAQKTNYIDYAELVFGASQDEGLPVLLSQYGATESSSLTIAYDFYYSLAGVMQDLSERKMAYIIGWKAIDLLAKIEADKTDFEKGLEYNYLYYCVNKHKADTEIKDPLFLLEKAKKILEGVPEEQHNIEYKRTYAAVLSNMGAHNVSVYCMNPKVAKDWHLKCLEYRRNNGLSSLNDTYRTLMTDCFYFGKEGKINEFEHAYYFYCAALNSLTGKRKLSEVLDEKIPVDLIVRAIGNEIIVLKESIKTWLEQEIVHELPYQIDYVYQEATRGRRYSYDTLKDLHRKMHDLLHWERLDSYKILKVKVMGYLDMQL